MFLFAWSSGLCNIKEFQLLKLLLSNYFLSQAENSTGLLDIRIKASKGNRNKGRVLACDKLCKTFSLRFNLKLLFQYESTITKTPFSISKVPRVASAVIRSNGIVTKRIHTTWMDADFTLVYISEKDKMFPNCIVHRWRSSSNCKHSYVQILNWFQVLGYHYSR